MWKWLICLFFSVIVLVGDANSQAFYARNLNRKWTANAGLGIGSYFGDLNNPGDIVDFTPQLNLGMRYLFGRQFSVGSNLAWFITRGDDKEAKDPGRAVRNLSFTSNNIELNFVGYVDFFPRGPRFYQRPTVNPYAFAGFGITYYNPKAKYDGKWYALRPLKTEGVGYSPITAVIPAGLGIRFRITPYFDLSLEGGYRVMFTDYFDDVSNRYIDPNLFTDPIARKLADRRDEIGLPLWDAGHVRGNPDSNDGYFLFNAKIEYYLTDIFKRDAFNRTIRRRK